MDGLIKQSIIFQTVYKFIDGLDQTVCKFIDGLDQTVCKFIDGLDQTVQIFTFPDGLGKTVYKCYRQFGPKPSITFFFFSRKIPPNIMLASSFFLPSFFFSHLFSRLSFFFVLFSFFLRPKHREREREREREIIERPRQRERFADGI